MKIIVSEVIGSNSATIRDHGLAVYEMAKKALENNETVEISFDGITMVISSFLNASVGKLYGDFPFDEDDMELLQVTVIPNAKEYYSDPVKIENIEQSAMGA